MPECFADDFSKSVGSLSEKELIACFCAGLKPCMPPPPEGAGDDCAVLKKSGFLSENILSTSDAVILGRHFSADTPARLAGRKLLNRNISDIASMGGFPLFAMTSSIISPKISIAWLEEFARGLREAALEFGVKFIGGDVASAGGDFFSMHLTLLGHAQRPLLRSGAKLGDRLFATGSLGASFESGRHLSFCPRVKEGAYLASSGYEISACTDLSDGLASDIFDILSPCQSAEIFEEKIPIFNFAGNTLKKALCDGEDYELLFAVSNMSDTAAAAFAREFYANTNCPVSEIGRIAASENGKSELVIIDKNGAGRKFGLSGFSHF